MFCVFSVETVRTVAAHSSTIIRMSRREMRYGRHLATFPSLRRKKRVAQSSSIRRTLDSPALISLVMTIPQRKLYNPASPTYRSVYPFHARSHAGIVFTHWSKTVFSPQGRHIAPINAKSGQKYGNTAPKTFKISNFGHNFVPQGRLICSIFTKFSEFVRVCIGSF